MSYKIPVGICSCHGATDTNSNNTNNNAGAVSCVKEYKRLIGYDKTVSLKGNMIAVARGNALATVIEPQTCVVNDNIIGTSRNVNGIISYVPASSSINGNPWVYFEGRKRIVEGTIFDNHEYIDNSTWDYFMANKVSAINYWRQYACNIKQRADSFQTTHIAKTINGDMLDYYLEDYLDDFPDMMSLDEIIEYLKHLYVNGKLNVEHVMVPLTDRISYSGEYKNSFLYVAIFDIHYDAYGLNIRLNNIYGIELMLGTGLATIQNYIESEGETVSLIFCQKRRYFATTTINLDLPEDFNINGKATIAIENFPNGYIELNAPGAAFVPIHGERISWNNFVHSILIPVSPIDVGCIELETVKNLDSKYILISEHLSEYASSASSVTHNPEDIDDVLDTYNIKTIYGSGYSYENI